MRGGIGSSQLGRVLVHEHIFVMNPELPVLLEGGVSQRDIDTMLIDNPRRHFEGSAQRFGQSTGESK